MSSPVWDVIFFMRMLKPSYSLDQLTTLRPAAGGLALRHRRRFDVMMEQEDAGCAFEVVSPVNQSLMGIFPRENRQP
jgi:hypothetical protein